MEFLARSAYFYTPFLAWGVAFICKLVVNSIKAGKLDLSKVTHGAMPSNHATIIASMASLIFFREGMMNPAFGVAMSTGLIVMMDAHNLRVQVGLHAKAINHLTPSLGLRERTGHTYGQIFVGILLGIGVGFAVSCL